jgi:hypothetical protein
MSDPAEPPADAARRFLREITDGGADSADMIHDLREERALRS